MNPYTALHHMNELSLGVGNVYTPDDIDTLRERIQDQVKRSRHCEERNYDKMQYSNPYSKEVDRLNVIIDFLSQGLTVERIGGGLIEINNKFIVSLANPKWRVKGKSKWYWYTNAEQFVKKYINKEK